MQPTNYDAGNLNIGIFKSAVGEAKGMENGFFG